jgi:hypothetical protein
MSMQCDECCIARPTRSSALSTNVVRLRLRLRILNLNNNATAYLIQSVSTIYISHRFLKSRNKARRADSHQPTASSQLLKP